MGWKSLCHRLLLLALGFCLFITIESFNVFKSGLGLANLPNRLARQLRLNYNAGKSYGAGPVDSALAPGANLPTSEITGVVSSEPKPVDICNIIFTGFVGTDPKDLYLKNDLYVVNFLIGMSNHLHPYLENPTHDSTFWIKAEMKGSRAKEAVEAGKIRKGLKLGGSGIIISNSYKDKTTMEEKKFYSLRIIKLLENSIVQSLSKAISEA